MMKSADRVVILLRYDDFASKKYWIYHQLFSKTVERGQRSGANNASGSLSGSKAPGLSPAGLRL